MDYTTYLERWRDWPYEARQPVLFFNSTKVPIPAVLYAVLGDEGNKSV